MSPAVFILWMNVNKTLKNRWKQHKESPGHFNPNPYYDPYLEKPNSNIVKLNRCLICLDEVTCRRI